MRSATAYTPEYIEKCFTVWYSLGRPDQIDKEFMEQLPKDEYGRVPSSDKIRKFRIKYGWIEHANELDNQALAIRDTSLIQRKAELLLKQAEDAFALAQKAHTHLLSGTFDSSAAAVQAYFRATEEIRKVVGLSDLLQRLGDMSDEEIQDEIRKRFVRLSDTGQTLDAEEIVARTSDDETS